VPSFPSSRVCLAPCGSFCLDERQWLARDADPHSISLANFHLRRFDFHRDVARHLHAIDRRTPGKSARKDFSKPRATRFRRKQLELEEAKLEALHWERQALEAESATLVVCNFTPVPRPAYRLGVPRAGRWREALNSDAAIYGGSGMGNGGYIDAHQEPAHGRRCSLSLTVPPLAALFLEPGA